MPGLDAIFAIVGEILKAAVSWLPRPLYVPRFEAVVRWTLGRNPRVFSGCVLWHVPLLQEYERIDLRADATEFPPVVLWTKNGEEVALGMVIVWRVGDPLRCAEQVNGLGYLVAKVGESVLPELVGSFTLEELRRKAAGGEGREWGVNAHLERKLAAAFAEYGITVDRARVNFTSSRVRAFKLIGTENDRSSVGLGGSV